MPETTTETLYCANHPDRETLLRCNRCEKPICYQCAIQTPVGYRCRECVNQQQSKYYTGASYDVVIGAATALILGAVVGALAYAFLGILGFFSFIGAIFLGPAAGGAIAEAVRRVLRKRRARGMKVAAAIACVAGIFLGGLLLVGLPALGSGVPLASVLGVLPRLFFRLDVILLAVLAASTIYARTI